MDVENQTLASEFIAEQEKRRKKIIFELDSTIDDFLEKSKFILNELIDLVDEKPKDANGVYAFAIDQRRMNMLANIAFDYLHQAQVGIEEIVTRERK